MFHSLLSQPSSVSIWTTVLLFTAVDSVHFPDHISCTTYLFVLPPGARGKLSGRFLLCKWPGARVQEETGASERGGHLEEQSHNGEPEQRRESHRAELWGESGIEYGWLSLQHCDRSKQREGSSTRESAPIIITHYVNIGVMEHHITNIPLKKRCRIFTNSHIAAI